MIFRDVSEKKKKKKKKNTRLMTWRRTRARNIGWSCRVLLYIFRILKCGFPNLSIYKIWESAKERTNIILISASIYISSIHFDAYAHLNLQRRRYPHAALQ